MAERDPEFRVEDVTTLCRTAKSTLGPFGTNKLVVEDDGTVTVTASAAVLFERLDLSEPTVALLQSAVSDFRRRVGDGAATVATLAGTLLEEAERLHELGVHPTVVDRGFRAALAVATETLEDVTDPTDPTANETVARTALTGTRDPAIREQTASFVAESVGRIGTHDDSADTRSDVGVVARLGGARSETDLIPGVVLDDDPVAEGMPRRIEDAGIAVLSSSVDVRGLGTVTGRRDDRSVELATNSFEDRATIGDVERESFRETVREIRDAGCRCLVTTESVNDRVKTVLGAEGVLALHQVDDAEAARIARATDARIVPNVSHVSDEVLGRADVTVTRKAGRDMTVVRGESGEGVYTLFCRAPDPRSVEAFERSVESAVAAVSMAEEGGVVPGGGATEMAASRRVRSEARSRDDREQLAMTAFADALESVPATLAENAGLDGIDALARLRARHDAGDTSVGVEASLGEISDVLAEETVLEPAILKRRAFETATDLAVQIVRVDDVVPATELHEDGRTHGKNDRARGEDGPESEPPVPDDAESA